MAAMTRTQFIGKLEGMVEKLKVGRYEFIDLEAGFIFANQHYGEVQIQLAAGTMLKATLFNESDEESKCSSEEGDSEDV